MPKIAYILSGVPCSGKTTWLNTNGYRLGVDVVVSSDNIIEEIAKQYGMSYDDAFRDLIEFAGKVFWKELEEYAAKGYAIAIDRTNLTPKARKPIMDILKKNGYDITGYDFSIPPDWDERLQNRPGKTIPKAVLDSMKASYMDMQKNAMTIEEGFSKIYYQ